jgi:serine/threonine protein kinase
MTPQQWREIKDLPGRALELVPDRRIHYLDAACAGNAEMRTELDSLLRSYEEDSFFLSVPAVEAFVPAADLDTASRLLGSRFGAYELLGVIAEGGMGTVYRAKRADGRYDKQVAIKIIKAERPGRFFVSHFETERRILARLEHPNIAHLLDGGVTSEGLPFLVLEYIDGTPIDQYCGARELSVPQRLELFRTVCAAVQYAHQNLVVHRDLKPANILVTADGIPKLLDFGVAKAFDPQQDEAQGATSCSNLVGFNDDGGLEGLPLNGSVVPGTVVGATGSAGYALIGW